MTDSRNYFIVGGAGFIGSHFTDRLLSDPTVTAVTLYDNFSSGREWHYSAHEKDSRFGVVRGDAGNLDLLTHSMIVSAWTGWEEMAVLQEQSAWTIAIETGFRTGNAPRPALVVLAIRSTSSTHSS